MDAFTTHTGTAAPLRRSNVDTDQIIPAEYLKRITRTGFEDGLFDAWRTNEPDFVLNLPQYADASILVAGPDFGTGSSREHAVWALLDGGFRVVISSRFADIFRNNSTKAGLLTVLLPQEDVEALWKAIEEDPSPRGDRRPAGQGGPLRRGHRGLRDRRLHPLAAARGARRRRPHRAAPRRHRGVRGAPSRVAAEGAAGLTVRQRGAVGRRVGSGSKSR